MVWNCSFRISKALFLISQALLTISEYNDMYTSWWSLLLGFSPFQCLLICSGTIFFIDWDRFLIAIFPWQVYREQRWHVDISFAHVGSIWNFVPFSFSVPQFPCLWLFVWLQNPHWLTKMSISGHQVLFMYLVFLSRLCGCDLQESQCEISV